MVDSRPSSIAGARLSALLVRENVNK